MIVFWSALKTGFGSRAFCTSSLNTSDAEQVLEVRRAEVDLVQVVLGVRDRLDRLLAGVWTCAAAPGVLEARTG